jgi:hypothetical protein
MTTFVADRRGPLPGLEVAGSGLVTALGVCVPMVCDGESVGMPSRLAAASTACVGVVHRGAPGDCTCPLLIC